MSIRADASPVFDSLKEQIVRRTTEYFPDLGSVENISLSGTYQRTYSVIYFLKLRGANQKTRGLVVKICKDAAAQYMHMMQIWPAFKDVAELKIPRPLDLFENDSALVMEEAAGIPLTKTLPRVWWSNDRLAESVMRCERAGHWLRFYHDLGDVRESEDTNMDVTLKDLEEAAEDLQASGFDAGPFRKVLRSCQNSKATFTTKRFFVANLHGDFKLDNIIVDETSVTVLDICGAFRNTTDLDVAAFVNSILMLRLTQFLPWPAIDSMKSGFLRGYFVGREPDALRILLLQIIGLAAITIEIGQRRSGIARFWLESMLKNIVEKLAGDVRRIL